MKDNKHTAIKVDDYKFIKYNSSYKDYHEMYDHVLPTIVIISKCKKRVTLEKHCNSSK